MTDESRPTSDDAQIHDFVAAFKQRRSVRPEPVDPFELIAADIRETLAEQISALPFTTAPGDPDTLILNRAAVLRIVRGPDYDGEQ